MNTLIAIEKKGATTECRWLPSYSEIGGRLKNAQGNRPDQVMARIIGVSPATISRVCNGVQSINASMLGYFCAVEGHDAHRLIFGHGYEQPPDTLSTLLPKLLDLPLEDRLAALSAVVSSVQDSCRRADSQFPTQEPSRSYSTLDNN